MGSNYKLLIPLTSIGGTNNLPAIPLPIPSAGIWFINYQIRISPVGVTVATTDRFFTEINLNGVPSGGLIEDSSTHTITSQKFMSHNGSTILNINNTTSSVTINTVINILTGTMQCNTDSYIQIVRIG